MPPTAAATPPAQIQPVPPAAHKVKGTVAQLGIATAMPPPALKKPNKNVAPDTRRVVLALSLLAFAVALSAASS